MSDLGKRIMWFRCGYPAESERWVWGVRIQQQVQVERLERQAGGQDCWVVIVTADMVSGVFSVMRRRRMRLFT